MAWRGDRLRVGAAVRHPWLLHAVKNPYVILAAVIAALVAWTFWPREKPDVGKSAPLPPAKEVRTVEKIIERPRIVYVYPQKTKQALDLPQDVVTDPAKKVITTGKLDADEREYSLSAVLDISTGESQIYAKPLPLPLIGPGKHGGIGIGYGLTNDGPAVKLYGYQELLRIKKLNAGVRAEADQRGEYWAGATLEYRW